MKLNTLIAALTLTAASAFAAAPALVPALRPADSVVGDYVEVRTASVFAGACHYNGELVTTGRDAVLAWNVTSGKWKGTDLVGVRAAAAVTSDANLGDEHAARKSELVIDTAATDAQAAAFSEAVHAKYSAALGQIVSVRRASVKFRHDGDSYSVSADHFVSCAVDAMPDGECCKQPNLVWYTPLVALSNRKVGFTKDASYAAGSLCDMWERSGENSAFYGSFAF